MRKIAGVKDLVEHFGQEKFGRLLFPRTKQPRARANEIKKRGFIPPHHWPKIMAAAEKAELSLTLEQLQRWRLRAPPIRHRSAEKQHGQRNPKGAHPRPHS